MPSYTAAMRPARLRTQFSARIRRAALPACMAGTMLLGTGMPLTRSSAQSVSAPSAAARGVEAAKDPVTYAELWQAAAVAVDQGEFERDEKVRAALFAKATGYARRAVALNPNDAEGHFHLSRAIGRTALALGPRERTKYGIEVREQALEALRLKPRHPGALHVMGVWNAEIMRLSGFSRAVAKTFLGGQIFSSASWAEAARYLEMAVQVEPDRLIHKLDLARIYRDMGRSADARSTYTAALSTKDADLNDAVYRQQAGDELRRLR